MGEEFYLNQAKRKAYEKDKNKICKVLKSHTIQTKSFFIKLAYYIQKKR